MSLDYIFSNYAPAESSISLKGGRLIENLDNNRIAIMPDSSVVVIEIRRKDHPITRSLLYAVQPPRPVFEVIVDGKSFYSYQETASGSMPTTGMVLKPVSDASFEEIVPKDAQYSIERWELVVKRSDKVIFKSSVAGSTLSSSEFKRLTSLARINDVLEINLLSMKRRNAVGELIDQEVSYARLHYTIK